jgi:motility quorum-sensing regulator/GCU-specific mRNA interferase toxin
LEDRNIVRKDLVSIIGVENLNVLRYSVGMEKKKPHCDLSAVHALISQGKFMATRTILRSAANDFGLTEERDLGAFVQSLSQKNFYKSMTTKFDSRLWRDVYRMKVKGADAYIKVQVVEDGAVIISFKKWETD